MIDTPSVANRIVSGGAVGHQDPVAYVYALIDPRDAELRYVGQTADEPARRLRSHLDPWRLDYESTPKTAWIKSLLAQGIEPEMIVLEQTTVELVDERERFWIGYWRALLADRLTNRTAGGTGGRMSPEAIERGAAKRRGQKRSSETRAKMSASHKARTADPEVRAAMREIALLSGQTPPVMPGESNPRARLSDDQVREIRQRADAGETGASLAREFGVTAASVTQIVTGQTRASAGGPMRAPRVKTRLSRENVRRIRQLAGEGLFNSDIARKFKVDPSHVSKILSGTRCLDTE